jgi:hypothetical protein
LIINVEYTDSLLFSPNQRTRLKTI